MTDGEDDAPADNNFAEFEAAAKSGEPAEPANEPAAAAEPEPDPDDAPNDDDDTVVNDDATDDPDKPERRRSKPAHARIAQITAEKHDAIRRAEAAEARLTALETGKPAEAPAVVETAVKPDPNAKNDDGSDKYEFGEADPNYLADVVDWKVDQKLATEKAKTAEADSKRHIAETAATLNTQWAEKATKAAEKYPDFETKVLESAAAGDWKCGVLMSAAISASDQGADIAYHLATHPEEAAQLDEMTTPGSPKYDPFQAVRLFGRMEARFETPEAKPTGKTTTNAPEPPSQKARGAGGKFEVDGSTSDFAAFEKKANAQASSRR